MPEGFGDLLEVGVGGELERGSAFAQRHGVSLEGPWVPLLAVGSGKTLNQAVAVGLGSLSKIARMDVLEVRNCVATMGCIEIGRLPGWSTSAF